MKKTGFTKRITLRYILTNMHIHNLKVKLMSKMKILHIKELILLIILVKQNHSTHINKKNDSYLKVSPRPGVEPATPGSIAKVALECDVTSWTG